MQFDKIKECEKMTKIVEGIIGIALINGLFYAGFLPLSLFVILLIVTPIGVGVDSIIDEK